jgi:hypothetical protein
LIKLSTIIKLVDIQDKLQRFSKLQKGTSKFQPKEKHWEESFVYFIQTMAFFNFVAQHHELADLPFSLQRFTNIVKYEGYVSIKPFLYLHIMDLTIP